MAATRKAKRAIDKAANKTSNTVKKATGAAKRVTDGAADAAEHVTKKATGAVSRTAKKAKPRPKRH